MGYLKRGVCAATVSRGTQRPDLRGKCKKLLTSIYTPPSSVTTFLFRYRRRSIMVSLIPSMVSLLLACVSGHASELPVTRTSRGYCGVTPSESDCAAGSMGAWTETNPTGCIQRCFDCARCRFVSFSPELQDCSWYNKCSLAHLQGADGTHETVQVCYQSTLTPP